MSRFNAMGAALLLGLASPCATAHGDQTRLGLEVGAGVQVEAQVQEGGGIAALFKPSGKRQMLPGVVDANEDAVVSLSAEDVDFDGRPELVARVPVGMVNEAVAVYRYDPRHGKLVALEPVTDDHAHCGGLMGLAVDTASRTLSSTCRSGPMWYVDLYRYHQGRLYLYRAERLLMLGDALEATIFVKQTADSGPMAVWSTYDPSGKVLETAISDGLVAPHNERRLLAFSGQVVPARLPLYTRPGDASTKRYLLRDDRVELLDEKDGWVKVRYVNPTRGDIFGWVNANP